MEVIHESDDNFELFRSQFENTYNKIQGSLNEISNDLTDIYLKIKDKYGKKESKRFIYFVSLNQEFPKDLSPFVLDVDSDKVYVSWKSYDYRTGKVIINVSNVDVKEVSTSKMLKKEWDTIHKQDKSYLYGPKYGEFFDSFLRIYYGSVKNLYKKIDEVLSERGLAI